MDRFVRIPVKKYLEKTGVKLSSSEHMQLGVGSTLFGFPVVNGKEGLSVEVAADTEFFVEYFKEDDPQEIIKRKAKEYVERFGKHSPNR